MSTADSILRKAEIQKEINNIPLVKTGVTKDFILPNQSGDKVKIAYDHSQDNTQAHSDYLKNDAVDEGVGLTLTGDNSSADTAYVPMVLYNTDATPPAANTVPIGTIYIQYTP